MTCDTVHSTFLDFSLELISPKDKISTSARFSLLLTVLNWGTSGTSGNSSVQAKRKITQGMETSLLWLHAWKLRTSQLIQHSGACVCWSSQGTMAFTVQAAMWETDLFMFSFVSFWGIKYGCFFLYPNATEAAGNFGFLVPNTSLLFPETMKSNDLFEVLLLW